MKKLFIKNRHNKKLSVIVEEPKNSKGLAFVFHGMGGFKEQNHIQTMAKAFVDNGYTAIRFDAANTIGESEGSYNFANVTSYLEDLEDIIAWTKTQDFYQEPFCLAGHSLGSGCILYYTEKYPEKVKALAPTSVTVSGQLILEKYSKEELDYLDKTGWKIEESPSKPGVMKELKWHQFKDDIINYDGIKDANKINMPILLVVGSEDHGTTPDEQKMIYDRVSGDKELHVIQGCGHVFKSKDHLKQLYNIFDSWIKNKL